MRWPNETHFVSPRVYLDMPGGDDAPLQEELMAPRAGEDVLELADLFPSVIQTRAEADNGTGLGTEFLVRLDTGFDTGRGEFDLLVT